MSQAAKPKALSPAQLQRVASLFKALGEPTRLRILQSLCLGPQSVSQIVEATPGSTQANISKHLALLLQAGVLDRNRDGQHVFYQMRGPLVPRLCELVCASLDS